MRKRAVKLEPRLALFYHRVFCQSGIICQTALPNVIGITLSADFSLPREKKRERERINTEHLPCVPHGSGLIHMLSYLTVIGNSPGKCFNLHFIG